MGHELSWNGEVRASLDNATMAALERLEKRIKQLRQEIIQETRNLDDLQEQIVMIYQADDTPHVEEVGGVEYPSYRGIWATQQKLRAWIAGDNQAREG